MKADNAPSFSIFLDQRKALKNNLYPVKLRVYYERKYKYYSVTDRSKKRISMSEPDFNRIVKNTPDGTSKSVRLSRDETEIRLHIHSLEAKAMKVIQSLPVFTWESFEPAYFGLNKVRTDILSSLRMTADSLREEGRIGSSQGFLCAANSLELFTEKKIIPFDLVTVPFLKKYEQWMQGKGRTDTTIGIYLRNVRIVYRRARLDGKIKEGILYPFGMYQYEIPTGANTKKALTHADIKKIADYQAVPGSLEEKYRDYWMFSFLCNGINVKDLANLKYKNIDGDVIRFQRAKTLRKTRKKPRLIELVITRQVGRIIDRWANKPAAPETYLFPILAPGMNPVEKYKRIQHITQQINRHMKQTAGKVGIPGKVTTYTARHSFATIMKRSGASTELISEALGHTNLQTTDNYLASFEMEVKRHWAQIISNYDSNENDKAEKG